MAARDQLLLSMRALTLRSPSSTSQISRCFSVSSVDQASTVQQRRRHRDPYAVSQARARKAANVSRQEVLRKERASALGDPVRGITTPFVQSFDSATPSPADARTSDDPSLPSSIPSEQQLVNYFLSTEELSQSLKRSEGLTIPNVSDKIGMLKRDIEGLLEDSQNASGPSRRQDYQQQITRLTDELDELEHKRNTAGPKHATAMEALNRITSLANGSSKDRLRVNIQRCVSKFGRHETDATLQPKAPIAESIIAAAGEHTQPGKTPRAGPDTGSSEVQIAILTAKIRTLADFLQTRGRMDKVNKRNLRLLVHRRQKLLTYLKRKERGGPRWQHVIDTLGLTPGTYEGEISL